jgi:hypothetical protein
VSKFSYPVRENVGFLDIAASAAERDTAVILPTLDHAVYFWWPRLIEMFKDLHDEDMVVTTQTAIVLRNTRTALRLWVPYWREPVQPMDFRSEWHKFVYITPYKRGELHLA